MRNRFKNLLAIATASLLATVNSASARDPISIEALSSMPKIQSVSMSSDGKNIVALVGKQGAEEYETSLATWKLDNLEAGPTITASGDRMRFIAASALKADRVFVFARQEWTGALQGCGEGNSTGSTKTFVSKAYLTDTKHSEFSEAFAAGTRTAGVSAQTERCLELAGTASLVNGLPLDPTKVIVSRLNPLTFQENYYRYDLATDKTELLFRASGRDAPGLLNPRNGEVLTTTTIEPTADGLEQQIKIRKAGTDEFVVHPALSRKIKDRYTMAVVGLDEATGKYYVLTDAFSDLVQARMYDPATSKFDDEPLLAHPKYSIANIVLGSRPSDFNKVLGFTIANMNGDTVWIDPQLAAIHEGLMLDAELMAWFDARGGLRATGFRLSQEKLVDGRPVPMDRRRINQPDGQDGACGQTQVLWSWWSHIDMSGADKLAILGKDDFGRTGAVQACHKTFDIPVAHVLYDECGGAVTREICQQSVECLNAAG